MAAVGGIALVTALAPFRDGISSTTVALGLLLVVLFVATAWGSAPAYLASVLGMLCFNFFFLPPIYTLTISEPQNWIALAVFLITAITVGQLSARARRRAEEAEAGRRESRRLYDELQAAFERASEAEALRRSEQLKSALLDAVTHDLRTPLTSIKASVTTLLGERVTPTASEQTSASLDEEGQRELLDVINEETDRLNHFIENMVELARIEAGELSLQEYWGAVDEIIASAVQRAAGITAKHDIEVEIAEHLPALKVDARAVTDLGQSGAVITRNRMNTCASSSDSFAKRLSLILQSPAISSLNPGSVIASTRKPELPAFTNFL